MDIDQDKLILSGLTFYGFHGVKPEERTLGQRFVVDVDAWTDLRDAGISDNVADTIDYTEIYSIVKQVLEGPPHNLLESIAHHIASNTFAKFPRVSAVRVKVKKPHVSELFLKTFSGTSKLLLLTPTPFVRPSSV